MKNDTEAHNVCGKVLCSIYEYRGHIEEIISDPSAEEPIKLAH